MLFQGLTFPLGFSIFSAVLGMLQFGYNTGVINAPESVRSPKFFESNLELKMPLFPQKFAAGPLIIRMLEKSLQKI